MKHGKKLKMNQIWNRYICPAIEWTGYGIGIAVSVAAIYFSLVVIILALG